MTLRERRSSGLSPLAAIGAVAVVAGVSAFVGRRNAPDRAHPGIRRWYGALAKPGYTPPDAVFGAVWPVLETGLAIGGYRLLRKPPARSRDIAIALWLLNTGLVGGWTELFFRRHKLGASVSVSAVMIAVAAAYASVASRTDRVAQATALPFAAWLCFATVLAEGIRKRNPSDDGDTSR